MKIGARIIKTGIAVSITMFICQLFRLEPAVFGAVSAVINMQPSIFLTVKTAKDHFLVHALGVSTATVLGYLLGGNPLSMGLITIVVIALYKKTGLRTSVSSGVVAAVFILTSSQEQFLPHALMRTGVIFAGLATAMVVNVLLWPPKYGEQFRLTLGEANEQAVRYFSQALHDYVHLQDEPPAANDVQRRLVTRLNTDVRMLADLCKNEDTLFSAASSTQYEWFATAKRLRDYNESLVEKADRIYALLPVRYDRRKSLGEPDITPEFRGVLELLDQGDAGVIRVNEKLRAALLSGQAVAPEEISEAYWEKLTGTMEHWQPEISSGYYIHALIEVAVIANEIKSASRQAKKLLQECFSKGLI